MRLHMMGGSSLGILLLLAVLLPGCDSGPATYPDQCAAACKVPDTGPCASEKDQDCQGDCIGATTGLTAECAQCVAAHTGWVGSECTCTPGDICTACGYNSYGDRVACSPADSCTPENNRCGGYSIGNAIGPGCRTICGFR